MKKAFLIIIGSGALIAPINTISITVDRRFPASGERDPYTNEALAWELIGAWDTDNDHPDGYKKEFALMPIVDHVASDALEFEICSWQVNDARSNMPPEEFLDLCKKVVCFREQGA